MSTRATPDPRIAGLPPVMQVLAREVGYEATETFLAAFAGQRIYVPAQPRRTFRIWVCCGQEIALAVARLWGGENLKVPLAHGVRTRAMHAAIRKDPRSANQVAADYGMHVDSVYRIRGGRCADPRQADLFSNSE